MLKLLLILALVVYILSKVGGFFFRVGAASQNRSQQRKEGNGAQGVKKDQRNNIKGGDYVDFEEVK